MGRNRVITKIVISRTYDRILKHPLGFWKRDERVQFLSISFLSVSRIHSENRCGLRERLWDFQIFHEYKFRLSRKRKKDKNPEFIPLESPCSYKQNRRSPYFKVAFRIAIRKLPPEKRWILVWLSWRSRMLKTTTTENNNSVQLYNPTLQRLFNIFVLINTKNHVFTLQKHFW